MKPLNNTSTHAVITATKSAFSMLAVPREIIFDNGPQFQRENNEFCEACRIAHRTSSPQYPQPNGFIERQINQTHHQVSLYQLLCPCCFIYLYYVVSIFNCTAPWTCQWIWRYINTHIIIIIIIIKNRSDIDITLLNVRAIRLIAIFLALRNYQWLLFGRAIPTVLPCRSNLRARVSARVPESYREHMHKSAKNHKRYGDAHTKALRPLKNG